VSFLDAALAQTDFGETGLRANQYFPIPDLPFALPNSNVVHMTVKPADLLDDEAEGAGKTGSKGSIRAHNAGEESGAGCRCVIL
jgi:hypothetical protein